MNCWFVGPIFSQYQIDNPDAAAATSSKKDKPKDPNHPKRAITSFMVFCNAKREEVKAANGDISFTEVCVCKAEWFPVCCVCSWLSPA